MPAAGQMSRLHTGHIAYKTQAQQCAIKFLFLSSNIHANDRNQLTFWISC